MPEFIPKEKETLIMKVYLGKAERLETGEVAEIMTNVGGSPLIQFDNGDIVTWNWNELVNEAFEIRDKERSNNGGKKIE